MALTELQLPTKDEFYRNLRRAATSMNDLISQWKDLAEFIGDTESVDLDAMAVPAGAIRTDMVAFRTVLTEVVAFMEGTSTAQTEVPADVIDKIRIM